MVTALFSISDSESHLLVGSFKHAKGSENGLRVWRRGKLLASGTRVNLRNSEGG